MKHIFRTVFFVVCLYACCSCCDDDSKSEQKIDIPEVDIADEIVGEWVYDIPEENAWQSMKFVAEGSYFCYSDKKENWTEVLRNINKGSYGVKGNVISAANGSTYLDMTVSKINGYEFTGRLNETTVDFKFSKVVMRTHLTFGQSILPPYEELVDTEIVGFKSHDESIAIVDGNTGQITAVANNGRTYVDIVTKGGTAVIKVMIGRVNDGDEGEFSPIKKKEVTPPQTILNLSEAILGTWIWDVNYWESITFIENNKAYLSNLDQSRDIYNDNAPGDYTIDHSTQRITTKWTLTGGLKMTTIMEIKSISKYSFTAKFYLTDGESTGTFTYAKKLGSIEINSGESTIPDYNKYVESGTVIKSYKSHNSNVAEADSETGEITAKMGGRTYIDVVTEDGTAVVEVLVKSPILYYNFDEFVWNNRNKVIETFGNLTSSVDGNNITYDFVIGEYQSATFTFVDDIVYRILLTPHKDAAFLDSEMINILTERYTPYASMTTNARKTFINGSSEEDSNVIIVYYLQTKQLLFTQFKR